MSQASLSAYDAILPELPRRENDVLSVLLERMRSNPDGQRGLTNRQIAFNLGLDRDSISPRTARLRQKGLIVEAGTDGKETLYEVALEPQYEPKPKRNSPVYKKAIDDAAAVLQSLSDDADCFTPRAMLKIAIEKIKELAK